MSGFFPVAVIITFLAPAVMCFVAASRSRKTPVDSSTMSTPISFQGSASGSLSWRYATFFPSTVMDFSSSTFMSASSVP